MIPFLQDYIKGNRFARDGSLIILCCGLLLLRRCTLLAFDVFNKNMRLLSLRVILYLQFVQSIAFVFIRSDHTLHLHLIQHQFMCATHDGSDDNTSLSEDETKEETSILAASQMPKMGSSIGAENVGRMLFNEEILKSGRGDIRIGSMGKWKDFKGNGIVRNEEPKSK